MDLFKEEKFKEYEALGFKNQRKNLRTLKQVGTSDKKVDASRKALVPGKRISSTGKVYWETRKNRTDLKGQKI